MTADPSAALAAIRARVEAATEGPWVVMRDAEGRPWVGKADGPMVGDDPAQDDADATFQARARADVPFLLAEVQRRGGALAAVLALHRQMGGVPDLLDYCEADGSTWPCPTVAAITAHLTDEEWYCTACGSSGSHTYLGCTAHLPATPTTEEGR